MAAKVFCITLIIIVGLFSHRYYESKDLSIEQSETKGSGVALLPTSPEKHEAVKEKSMKYVGRIKQHALSENTSKDQMETSATDERVYFVVPNPLSDVPIIIERQAKSSSQVGGSKVIYVPNPLSDIPIEITLKTESTETKYYTYVPDPLSDTPIEIALNTERTEPTETKYYTSVPNPLSDTPIEIELGTHSTESKNFFEIPHPSSSDETFLIYVQ